MRLYPTGNAFEIGKSRGLSLQNAITFNLCNFYSAAAATGVKRLSLIESAKRLAQDHSDLILEEIRGMAAGAQVEEADLLAFNLCHSAVFADECTVLFAMGDATASGKVLFLKNSDKIGGASMVGANFFEHKEINVVLVIRPEHGPAIIGVSAAGSTGLKMGVSELGVVAGTNISRTAELAARAVDTTQMRALDRIQLAREGMLKSSALEAANFVAGRLAESPTATPGNIEFVDSKVGVIVEGSYDRVALHVVRSGIASRANAFVALRELNDPADASSCSRYVRTQQLLSEHRGRLTPDLMKQFSQDHTNGPGPNSICRHGKHYEEETSQSSMIVELEREQPKQTRFWIAMGKPCHAWRHPEGNFAGRMDQLERVPQGFLNGETWKRFWSEEPNPEAELVKA
ncbi:MAG: C45 family autoproteolytic acyltransferase/hydrolase [Terriglobia bacterium]